MQEILTIQQYSLLFIVLFVCYSAWHYIRGIGSPCRTACPTKRMSTSNFRRSCNDENHGTVRQRSQELDALD